MEVIYQTHPDVVMATNTFINVPVILQVENTPLLEVGRFVDAGYTTRFPVYYRDGVHVAQVVGAQIYLTKEGKNSAISTRHEQNLTAFELEGQTILELRRHGAAALKGAAELYAPTGVLVKANDAEARMVLASDGPLQIGGSILAYNRIINYPVGLHFAKDGAVTLGYTPPHLRPNQFPPPIFEPLADPAAKALPLSPPINIINLKKPRQ